MKVKVVSDLHLEFSGITIENDGADVLVLAGDILVADRLDHKDLYNLTPEAVFANLVVNFFDDVSRKFKHVVYIAGNHEYYHGKLRKTHQLLTGLCNMFANVHFLEKQSVVLEGVLFVGGTLWTDLNKGDPVTVYTIQEGMSDYKRIRNDDYGFRRLRPADTASEHRRTIKQWSEFIANTECESVIVVSHHAPTFLSLRSNGKMSALDYAYGSDLSNFILDTPKIKLWIHGHTHDPADYLVGDTRVVCNPRGYVSKDYSEETGWDPSLVISIP
jgi:Icc-related predicted phosphoesterase